MWDTSTQLSEEQYKLQRRYAKQVVKSILSENPDPKDARILLMDAARCTYCVWMEASRYALKHKETEDAQSKEAPKMGG